MTLKKYNIKFYSPNGEILNDQPDQNRLLNDISFSEEINKGQLEMTLNYNYPYDNFHSSLSEFNFVRVFDHKARLLYSGYVSRVLPTADGSVENVSVSILGLSNLLNASLFKNGSSFDVSYSSTEPADIIEDIIDDFQSKYPVSVGKPDWIGYNAVSNIREGGNIDSVGTNVSYDFKKMTWLASMNKILELSGGSWYWTIDKGGDTIFKQKPNTPTHRFVIGKNIKSMEIDRSMEEIINKCTVEYGNNDPITTEDSEDTTSQNSYGLREVYITDDDATDSTSAQQIADKTIEDNKNPKSIIAIEVLNQLPFGYDGETIRAGDTCEIVNIDKDFPIDLSNLHIVKVDYAPDIIKLNLEGTSLDIGKEISKIK